MYAKIFRTVGRLLLLLVTFGVIIVFSVVVYSAVFYPMYLKSQAEVGMNKAEVLENLKGKKYRFSDTLSICDSGAWYGDCEAASNSGSVEFLIFKIGIDTLLVVGFNAEEEVTFVGLGDT